MVKFQFHENGDYYLERLGCGVWRVYDGIYFPLFSCRNELEKNHYWESRNTGLKGGERAVGLIELERIL